MACRALQQQVTCTRGLARLQNKHGACPRRPLAAPQPRYPRRPTVINALSDVVEIPSQYAQVEPKGDLVLCKVAEAEDKSTGGVLLPSSAQQKPTSGDVAALGDGRVGETNREFELKEGDTVLYSKFGIGVTNVKLQGADYILIREDDCFGVMPHSGAHARDIPELRPIGDRVLLKVQEPAEVTSGGVLLPDSAKEKPVSGLVVRTGPGRLDEDGTRKPVKVKEGDKVLYFKYALTPMETPDGEQYGVLHDNDILCRV